MTDSLDLAAGNPDFEAEGLLEGLDGHARTARLELLQYLHGEGASLEELRRAVREERLALLPTERVLAGEQKYTVAEVSERSGIDVETFVAQQRAAGLPIPDPGERAFSDEDVEAARRLGVALAAGFTPAGMLEAARVFGEFASKAAAAARLLAGEALIRAGDTERDLAFRYAEAARTLHPQTIETLKYLYEAHMRDQLRNDMIAAAELESGHLAGTREVAVCFADLVGFTMLGQQIGAEDLGVVATRFRSIATDAARQPVSLIKMIGDAAMLVSPDASSLLDAALTLVESAEAEQQEFPALRAGVAMGEALNRWGDWYGSPVNVASRVTAVARPSSVLVTSEVRDAAGEGFAWSFAGRRRLKGLETGTSLYRCRRAEDESR
jgi:adenylate cyclase